MVQASNLRTRPLFWACFIICAELHLVFGQQYLGVISFKNGMATQEFYFDLEITNRGFNSSLLDPTSEYYKTTKLEVDDLMNAAFKCSDCLANPNAFKGTKDVTFRSGNLIIADMILVFEFNSSIPSDYITPNIISIFFRSAADKDTAIEVNTEYTHDIIPVTVGTPTTPPPTTTTQLTSSTTTLPTTTFTTTTPSTTPSSTTPSATSATFSGSTSGLDDVTTDHSASASVSASASTLYTTTGTASTTDIDHLKSKSGPASVTPRHLIESTNTTAATATTTAYPLVPYWFDWVPGWAIALLVLAALILLLLIILLILLLIRWCCMDEPDEPIKSERPDPYHSPYLSHSAAKTPILNMTNQPMTPEKPKEGRTGMYVVNP
ncbi:uncharacterized protein LOC134435770 [Engraulis encrasicolus]|uniref:uncharacterized protein LOC134435770 n=1 Tax=Engraulis encrasicolus TaxID=184585 RepID=UPI002FD631BD